MMEIESQLGYQGQVGAHHAMRNLWCGNPMMSVKPYIMIMMLIKVNVIIRKVHVPGPFIRTGYPDTYRSGYWIVVTVDCCIMMAAMVIAVAIPVFHVIVFMVIVPIPMFPMISGMLFPMISMPLVSMPFSMSLGEAV